MPDKPFALSIVPPSPPPAQDDYDAICATMMGSARGRWFLEEYARRNRNADTTAVLAAIERLEGVVRDEREQQAYHGFRAQLLDMAKAITDTRAEVAAIAPQLQEQAEDSKPEASADNGEAAAARPHVLAAAERIADVAWTMRERGIDPRTCDQIEALAASILKAPFLREADDQRAQQLGEVLGYLERRVNGMLAACAPAAPETPTRSRPSLVSPPAPRPVLVGARPVVLDANPAARRPSEPEPDIVGAAPPREASSAAGNAPSELRIGAGAAEPPPSPETAADAATGPAPTADLAPSAAAEPAGDTRANAAPIGGGGAAPESPARHASAIDAPLEAESADVLLGPMPLPVSPAASAAPVLSQPPPAPAVPETPAPPSQPAASPAPRAASPNPLAFLEALSPEERIALFT
jgi:hypothetical protein